LEEKQRPKTTSPTIMIPPRISIRLCDAPVEHENELSCVLQGDLVYESSQSHSFETWLGVDCGWYPQCRNV